MLNSDQTMFTLRQSLIPGPYVGRVVGITRTISAVPVPVAAIFGTYLLRQVDGGVETLSNSRFRLRASSATAVSQPFGTHDDESLRSPCIR